MNDAATRQRRSFLKQVAAAVGAAPLALSVTTVTGAAAEIVAESARAKDPIDSAHVWRFFNGNEARAVEAAVARLIPADDLGPGAQEAGVAVFIDLQLGSAWGNGDHLYRQPPFGQGTPQQG